MGKLVAPVYQLQPSEERILQFAGYNRKAVIADGEMRDMYNMSSDESPCLYQRKPRGLYAHGIENLYEPSALLVKDKKLAVISEGIFYYDGVPYEDLELSGDTKMVAINTKICFFPEKKYFVVKADENGKHEIGDIEGFLNISKRMTVTLTEASIVFPEHIFANEGTLDQKALDVMFKKGDAIKFYATGEKVPDVLRNEGMSAAIESVTGFSITFQASTFTNIIALSDDKVEVKDENDEGTGVYTLELEIDSFKAERTCPDLDYVLEYNNRLWGVSNADNTIYASKLGDPTNWAYFQSTNMDSYYAQQGTDGEWTGCAAYSAHILFFKEDWIHKVYGSKPGNYQITTAQCHALEKGSEKSVAVINETVFYKSKLGVMAYTGGTPTLISENFGRDKFSDAIAGTDGIKYYLSAMCNGEPELLVFDMEKMLWHKEDNTRVLEFCYHNGKVIYIDQKDGQLYEMDSETPLDSEKDIKWMVELGPFDEFIEEHKVYSKMKMRLKLEEGSELDIYIKINDGEWEKVQRVKKHSERAQFVPIIPRRCDKFSIKLEGEGNCRIESVVREFRYGSGRRDVK